MGLPTDSYIDIEIDEEVVDRIGLSASLSDISDIISGGYCGMHHLLWRNGQTKTTDADYTVSKTIPVELSGNTFPITVSEGHGDYNYPDGMFCGIVWLYSENSPMDYVINSSNIGDYKLVTEWDAPHYVYKPSPLNEDAHWTGKTHLSWADNDMAGYVWNNGYNNNFMRLEYWDDNEGTNVVRVDQIRPYLMFQNENGKHFLSIYDYSYQATFFYADTDTYAATTTLKDYTDSENIAFCVAVKTLSEPNILPKTGSSYGMINNEGMSVNDQFGVYVLTSASIIEGHNGYFAYSTEYAFHFKDDVFKDIAGCGLKFYTDKLYKPIISGGVVIGYTDDMDEESELDEWTGTTDHGIGPTPPVPPTPSGEDDIDSMGFDGMSCSVGGPAKYYIMSYSDIHHLIGDFNAHAEPGTSISNNIISCYVNALDWNWSTGSEPIEIYSGGAQTTAFTSDINYDVLTGYNARDIIGSIDVPRMTNTFYDFSPYSTYEVYVPFCGWVALPDTVAGRNIKVYFETDEATCGCKGRIFFVDGSGNGVTVAEITGSFGAPCPIQVLEGGLYKQAMLSNGLQVIGGIASGVMGGAMGAGALAVSGLSSAMQSLGNCLIAGNTNYGQTIGRAGDASGLMCAGKPYLKITYPPIDEVVNNSRFGHTVGYLCNTIGKLSAFSGFTVCANPHITGINCTDSEKEELKRLLEEGVIL